MKTEDLREFTQATVTALAVHAERNICCCCLICCSVMFFTQSLSHVHRRLWRGPSGESSNDQRHIPFPSQTHPPHESGIGKRVDFHRQRSSRGPGHGEHCFISFPGFTARAWAKLAANGFHGFPSNRNDVVLHLLIWRRLWYFMVARRCNLPQTVAHPHLSTPALWSLFIPPGGLHGP